MQLFERLCSNMEMQPPEFVVWTKNVAGLFAAHVPFPEVRTFHVCVSPCLLATKASCTLLAPPALS